MIKTKSHATLTTRPLAHSTTSSSRMFLLQSLCSWAVSTTWEARSPDLVGHLLLLQVSVPMPPVQSGPPDPDTHPSTPLPCISFHTELAQV